MPAWLRSFAVIWALLGGALLGLIVAITSVNAGAFLADRITDLTGGAPIAGLSGYEDVVRLLTGSATLMMLPYCQVRYGHVAVELFGERRGVRLAAGLRRVWLGLAALIALFLAVMLAWGLVESRADGALSRILSWPEWPFYAPGAVSLAVWALISALQCRYPEAEPDRSLG